MVPDRYRCTEVLEGRQKESLSRQGCDRDYKPREESAHAANHQNIVQRVTHGRPSVGEARCYRGQKAASLQRFAGEGVMQTLSCDPLFFMPVSPP